MGTSETGSAVNETAGTAEEAPGVLSSTVCWKFNVARGRKVDKKAKPIKVASHPSITACRLPSLY